MNALELIHPDDDFTREYLTKADWDCAQKQLDDGELPSDVARRLHAWAREHAYELEAECAEYNHSIESNYH